MDLGQLIEKNFLKPNNLNQSSLCRAINISKGRLSSILKGKRAITPDTDLRLCHYFGLEDGYFLNLQAKRDLKIAKEKLKDDLIKIEKKKNVEENREIQKKIKVALICGGPSLERGISLNSARSILDHLSRDEVEIIPIYVDLFLNFYLISKSQLYSNNPSDFDFKLQTTSQKISKEELIKYLKNVDMVFPIIHGKFGEDGELQALLEQNQIPFVGSDSKTCQKMYDKHNANSLLKRYGYPTLPIEVLRKEDPHMQERINDFFKKHNLTRAVVKPIAGGSSIGVYSAYDSYDAKQKVLKLFDKTCTDEALLESFCQGREFTIIILQNLDGSCVSLIPTEIEIDGAIFDYRRKYLPTSNTHWFCPPRFEDKKIEEIRNKAEELFKIFKMRDFARIDGWLLNDGKILFTDFNPLSGMEQNSFIFQQSSRIGFTHRDLLWNILKNALGRQNIKIEESSYQNSKAKQRVNVLFGGPTAERQVSLMTGTNVWLKLKKSKLYEPHPYLLDQKGSVWYLPYTYALNHTVEEIYENCLTVDSFIDKWENLVNEIKRRLCFAPEFNVRDNFPKKLSFEDFVKESKEKNCYIFLALHGGDGENGKIQQILENHHISYNGSDPKTSELCMDKYLTGQAVSKMADPNILTVPKKQIKISSFNNFQKRDFELFFVNLQKELLSDTFIIKPQKDGCSAGIVRLFSADELQTYLDLVRKQISSIPINTFKNQLTPVEMPSKYEDDYLLESFIETDHIRICKNDLIYKKKNGFIELTVGVLERENKYHSLSPSITIAEGEVLSVEEKFQGGTGINITPPAKEIISDKQLKLIKKYVEKIAKSLNIKNYSRLDIFFNVISEKLYLIEVNSLPALTPATVLYHQALAESNALYPTDFLENLISMKR